MTTIEMTVRELLQLPIMQGASVISGAQGLKRAVQGIDILELPEPEQGVKPGMLLMTSGYSLRDQPSWLAHMIRTLAGLGAAGLAIKPDGYLPVLPMEAVQASEQYGFPVLELPDGTNYAAIIQAVSARIASRQAVAEQHSDDVYRKLTAMVLENIGIQAVNDHVSGLLKAPVAVIDNSGATIVASPAGWDYRHAIHPLRRTIQVDRRNVATLIVDKETLDTLEETGIEQARLVLALELMRNRIIMDTGHRLRGNFIDELMTPPTPPRHEVEQRGRQLGMDPSQLWEVAVIEGQTAPEEEWISQLLEPEAARYGVRPHVEFRSNRAILFLPTPAAADEHEARRKQELIPWTTIVGGWLEDRQGMLTGYRAGIGRPTWLWDIHESYSEARHSLSISSRLSGGGAMTAYKDIEIYHLLRATVDERGFGELFDRKLGKLKQYDEEHNSDLLRTLFFYLESRGSLMDTAAQLFIHRNSVKYRLERIREIAGFDLNDAHEQFVCHLCLIYYYLLERPD
ncbi:PucR family transcriptional regulator ligand-binding domain-containing protein [Paenibacillus hunanensis]|uniref:PucR family transcriptional regulator n=1 Tax=Paenibacillus hunanensis TaxID=539262 RepID=UPI0020273E7B|nr:PucR family transcriptional regulator [Paenibacillus hunanensis]MCL9661661.1 PucR family transcriptional regulator ligand-binding domain-containing protein [Paenibacillus hunanensis]